MRVGLEARPADRFFLHEIDRELDVERRLEPRPRDLAFALPRVAVAEEQERARLVHRQHHADARAHRRVVHVAAERARHGRRDRFLARRRRADAAEHRPQRQLEAARLHVALIEPSDAARLVDRPRHAARLAIDARGDGGRIDGVRREQAAGVRRRAVGLQLLDHDDQDVARLCALDVERAGLRIPARRDALAVPVGARRVDRLRDNAIAGPDPQRGRMRERVGRVEDRRREPVDFGRERRGYERQRERAGEAGHELHRMISVSKPVGRGFQPRPRRP